jgi:DNA-binding NarL/FixJ family response regulator
MTDLFFLVQVTAAAKPLGFQVVSVKDRAAALDKLRNGAEALVIDLTCAAAEPLDLIREAKTSSSATLIGFLPHIQTALREQALDAGCDAVVPRSAFAQKLPELLRAIA